MYLDPGSPSTGHFVPEHLLKYPRKLQKRSVYVSFCYAGCYFSWGGGVPCVGKEMLTTIPNLHLIVPLELDLFFLPRSTLFCLHLLPKRRIFLVVYYYCVFSISRKINIEISNGTKKTLLFFFFFFLVSHLRLSQRKDETVVG